MNYLKTLYKPLLLLVLAIILKTVLNSKDIIPEEYYYAFDKISWIVIITGLSWGAINLIKTIRKEYLDRHDLGNSNNLHARKLHTQLNILGRILTFIIIIVAVAATLMLFEPVRKLGISLFASAGIAGIILGFAAQKAIGTILAGLQIAISQPIRLDDVLVVEGEWGRVEEIKLTYVVVRIWDKRRLILPTTYFIEKPFENWTRTSADILGTVYLHTDYTIDFDSVREELSRLLEKHPLWDGEVNNLQVTDSGPEGVKIRALMSAKNAPDAWNLRVDIREGLINFIRKEFPDALPRTRVKLTNTSAL
ncbi:mechanosensitive ion channel [Robertkochia marina]|uniref:Mechanosensitive ion channel n=1 Tax=Robertkochia marina TaxID=1227945 RepID=A0A4V3UYK1_9FLAO|nr:mechanosensitive ion channel domain-containing protein [Robertkochia marina]THD69978.1 mechanosensitive ion channel [Robertkochia marina]TRZ46677.1 mechanosensitive ion channel family protein [Robertkochia marina]